MANNNGDNTIVTTGGLNTGLLAANVITTNRLVAFNDKGFHDLTAAEFLDAFKNSELVKLEAMVEDAKLMYEEEGDEDSFGEYQGLKQAYEWLKTSMAQAPSRIYNVPYQSQYFGRGLVQQPFGTQANPSGHTGLR